MRLINNEAEYLSYRYDVTGQDKAIFRDPDEYRKIDGHVQCLNYSDSETWCPKEYPCMVDFIFDCQKPDFSIWNLIVVYPSDFGIIHKEDNDKKDKVFSIVNDWMRENNCHDGEHAAQNDECNVNAIDLVCELADIVGVPYPDEL